jgi:hypothetical protein
MATEADVAKGIPAKFIMISGSEDKQTSADVFNVNQFELPNPAGKAGGACTSTLISVLNRTNTPLTWLELLREMRGVLRQKGFEQIPQLSASRMIDVNHAFEIVPQQTVQHKGARRAILIGINYTGAYRVGRKSSFKARIYVLTFCVFFLQTT